MTLTEAIQKYGAIENGIWANEAKWMVSVLMPDKWTNKWTNIATDAPVAKIYMNIDFKNPLFAALQNMEDAGIISELKTFDGCFNIRSVRGKPDEISSHAFGISIDINANTNVLGTEGDNSLAMAKCFTDAGFYWGKNFSRSDPMHFSLGDW